MARRTKITIETESLLILRCGNSTRAWCPQCGAEGEMIALADTRVVSNLDEKASHEWLTSGALHRVPAADGSTLICLNSLIARVQDTKPR